MSGNVAYQKLSATVGLQIRRIRTRGAVVPVGRGTITLGSSDPKRVKFFEMVVACGGILESVFVACLFGHAR